MHVNFSGEHMRAKVESEGCSRMYECSYRFGRDVTHCASLHWVTCVSFVQGLYAKSMLYRRMCMAKTWNSWSKKEDNTRNVRDAWQGQNQQEPVHLQCSSVKCCALMKRRHTDDSDELQPGQARPSQERADGSLSLLDSLEQLWSGHTCSVWN